MPYTNEIAITSLSVAWNSTTGANFTSIETLPNIPHSAQFEVTRIFTSTRTGNATIIRNFLINPQISSYHKRNLFVIPTNRITYSDTTTKNITAIELPLVGTNVYNYPYTEINSTTVLYIEVPPIANNDLLVIRRKTISNARLVNWVSGSMLTSQQLNLQTKQLMFLTQENISFIYNEVINQTTVIETIQASIAYLSTQVLINPSQDSKALDMTLPPASARALRFLTFKTNGEPEAGPTITEFNNITFFYVGAYATTPTVRRNQQPLETGDIYWDTVYRVMYVYNITQGVGTWINYEAGAIAAATAAANSFQNTQQISLQASSAAASATLSANTALAAKDVSVLGVRGFYTTSGEAISYGLNSIISTPTTNYGTGGVTGVHEMPVLSPSSQPAPVGSGGVITFNVSGGAIVPGSLTIASRGSYYSFTPQISFAIPNTSPVTYYGGFSAPPVGYALNVTKNVGPLNYFSIPSANNSTLLELRKVDTTGFATSLVDTYPNKTAVETLTNPSWAGKINGWIDPFFRFCNLTTGVFLNQKRIWQQNSSTPITSNWSLVPSTLFDGNSLNYKSLSVPVSGPLIILKDDLSLQVSDTLTISFLITPPANTSFSMFGKFNTLPSFGDSPTVGGSVQQYTLVSIAATATPTTQLYTVSVPCPNTNTYPYFVTYCSGGHPSNPVKIEAMWATKGGVGSPVNYPSFQGVEATKEIIKEVDLKIGALYSRFSWEGKTNGWYDPYFRDTSLFPNTLRDNKYMYSSNSTPANYTSLSIVNNTVYDGKAIKKTNSTANYAVSGPRIWISDLGLSTGDPISVSIWIVKDPNSTTTAQFSAVWRTTSDSDVAGTGQLTGVPDSGTGTTIVPTTTIQRLTISTTVPAGAGYLFLYPFNTTATVESFHIVALAATKNTFANSPLFPPLGNDLLYLDNKIKNVVSTTQLASDITNSTFLPITDVNYTTSTPYNTGSNFSSAAYNNVFTGWGSNYTVTATPNSGFNSITIATISPTVGGTRVPWNTINVVVKKFGPLDTNLPHTNTGVVVAVGSVNVNPSATSLSNLKILLKHPTTNLPITLTNADLINTAFAVGNQYYYIGVYAKTSTNVNASLSNPHGEMSNEKITNTTYNASSGYYITNQDALTASWVLITESTSQNSKANAIGVYQIAAINPVESTYYLPTPAVLAAVTSSIGINTDPPNIFLPEVFYGMQVPDGSTAEIYNFYYDNMFIGDDLYKYNLENAGPSPSYKMNNRSLEWAPKGSDVPNGPQNYPLSFNVRDKTTGLIVSTVSSGTTIKGGMKKVANTPVDVMVIGDSLVNYGYTTGRLLSLSSGTSLNITLRGTLGVGLNKHEGRGGWKISDYYNVPSITQGGVTVTNPFYNSATSLFDFSHYITNNPAQALNTATKWVIFSLGINDCFNLTTDASVIDAATAALVKLQVMINSVKLKYPTGLYIGVVLPPPPAAEQNAFAAQYGAAYFRSRYKRNITLWAKTVRDAYPFASIASNRTVIIPSNFYLDTKYNYPTVSAPVNRYKTGTLEFTQTDAVHPDVNGGTQIGDCTFAVINFWS